MNSIKQLGRNIIDTLKYGTKVGNTHKDGSVLRKGNDYLGIPNTKTLLDKDGEVKKFITRTRRTKDAFEITTATPIKSENNYLDEHNVVKTYYNNEPNNRFIQETSFIGRYFDGSDGGNRGWFLSKGNVDVKHTNLPNH